MTKLGFILAIYTFIGCFWWILATITGTIFMKFLCKLFGITGCFLSLYCILNYLKFI